MIFEPYVVFCETQFAKSPSTNFCLAKMYINLNDFIFSFLLISDAWFKTDRLHPKGKIITAHYEIFMISSRIIPQS